MKSLIAVVCGLCFIGLTNPSSARSHYSFKKCERYRKSIETMERELQDLIEKQRYIERRIEKKKKRMHERCGSNEKCDVLEEKTEKLKQYLEPMFDKMSELKKEIIAIKIRSDRLNKKTDRIENRYQQLRCDDLVPGETSQSTIDQCTDLFSRWNELRSGLNSLETSLDSLNSRYDRLARKTSRHESELSELTQEMNHYCSHSKKLVIIREMERRRHGHHSMKSDLDTMLKKVHRIRAIKLKRSPLKPKKRF